MTGTSRLGLNSRFANEHACVTYLFRRRWPLGFRCPFCGAVQKETAPAYTVVCRYCRKQTSITAQTIMHGSKMDLVAWLQVAWLFCSRSQGLSARELQRLMGLSCYQTAWSWLQKVRLAAALAESAPCRGQVLFDVVGLAAAAGGRLPAPEIAMALELNARKADSARVRFQLLPSRNPSDLTAAIQRLVMKNASLQLGDGHWADDDGLAGAFHCGEAAAEQRQKGQAVLRQAETWLQRVFRRAVDTAHLQTYLDEFSFHCNTAFWPDRQAVLDHLVTALLSADGGIHPYGVGTR
ncbi:MAG: IS1595 family transposase [Desulfoprunum sp.]|uniref:hypothetical protein n=1 Tax=Desulfoprunum sp. TaxID=2020866 RepID=UPI000A8DDA22